MEDAYWRGGLEYLLKFALPERGERWLAAHDRLMGHLGDESRGLFRMQGLLVDVAMQLAEHLKSHGSPREGSAPVATGGEGRSRLPSGSGAPSEAWPAEMVNLVEACLPAGSPRGRALLILDALRPYFQEGAWETSTFKS